LKIGILSDTHSYLDAKTLEYLRHVDEIWHAGDFGSLEIIEELRKLAPLKGVFGNIDGGKIRQLVPEYDFFVSEGLKVLLIHIDCFGNTRYRRSYLYLAY
jgi:putative phosphoesterase